MKAMPHVVLAHVSRLEDKVARRDRLIEEIEKHESGLQCELNSLLAKASADEKSTPVPARDDSFNARQAATLNVLKKGLAFLLGEEQNSADGKFDISNIEEYVSSHSHGGTQMK